MVLGDRRINTLLRTITSPADSDFIISACLEQLWLCLTGFRLRNLNIQDFLCSILRCNSLCSKLCLQCFTKNKTLFNQSSGTGQWEWFAQMEMAETDKYKSQYPVEMVAGTRLGQEPFLFLDEKLKWGNTRAPLALLRDDGLL